MRPGLEKGRCLFTLFCLGEAVRGGCCVAIAPVGETCVSGSDDCTLRVWGVGTGPCQATFELHAADVNDLVMTPDDRTVVSYCTDRTQGIWGTETDREPRPLMDHGGAVFGLAIMPDDGQLRPGLAGQHNTVGGQRRG